MRRIPFKALSISVIGGLVLMSCQETTLHHSPLELNKMPTSSDKPLKGQVPDIDIKGQIKVEPVDEKHVNLVFTLNIDSVSHDFKTQALDCFMIKYLKASVNGIGMSNPVYADGSDAVNHLLDATNAAVTGVPCGLSFTISNIPVGAARVATVEGFHANSATGNIPGSSFKTVFNAEAGTNGNYEISFKTTPGAMIIEQLASTDPLLVSTMNNSLQGFIDQITIPFTNPATGTTTYTTHPTLVNITAITNDLAANNGDVSQLNPANANYKLTPGSIDVNVNNIPPSDALRVILRDPASTENIVAGPGSNETINIGNISAGSWGLEAGLLNLTNQTAKAKFLFNVPHNAATAQIIDFNGTPDITGATNNGQNRFSAAPADTAVHFLGANLAGVNEVIIAGNSFTSGFIASGSSVDFASFPSSVSSGSVTLKRPVAGGSEVVKLQNFFALEHATELDYTAPFPVVAGGSQHYGIAYSDDSINTSMLVWQASNTGMDIYTSIIDETGAEIASTCNVNQTSANNQVLPDVAFDKEEGDFLVVWENQNGGPPSISARRISAGANSCVFSANEFVVDAFASSHENPAVAYGSNKMLVVWQDSRNGNDEIWGNLVDLSGGTDSPGTSFQIANGVGNLIDARVTYNPVDEEFFVVWHDQGNNKIMGQRLSNTGTTQGGVIDVSGPLVNELVPDVAYVPTEENEGHYLIAWEHDPGGNADIKAKVLESDGSVKQATYDVANAGNQQKFPRVSAGDKGRALIVYDDNNLGGGVDIAARFVNAEGTPLGLDSRINQNSDSANGQFQPVVTYNNAEETYQMLWRSDAAGQRLHLQAIRDYVD